MKCKIRNFSANVGISCFYFLPLLFLPFGFSGSAFQPIGFILQRNTILEDEICFSKANIAAFLAHLARFGLVLELLGNRGEEIIPQGGRDAQEEVGVEVAFAHNLGYVRGVGVDLLRQPNMLAALLLQDLRYHPAYMNVVNVHFAKSQKKRETRPFPAT